MPVIRPTGPEDLDSVAAIQSSSPEAAQWPVADYLGYESTVCVCDGSVAGFLVWRNLADCEYEVLNLVVAPAFRRQGVASQLIEPLLRRPGCVVFLEVRESNLAARTFYKSMKFKDVSIRTGYYENPIDNAIVMKFHSC